MSKLITNPNPKSNTRKAACARRVAFDDIREDGQVFLTGNGYIDPLNNADGLEVDFQMIAGYSESESRKASQNVLKYDEKGLAS